MSLNIPLDVPASKKIEYTKNLKSILNKKGRLLLFAGDQKIEHQNNDFFGAGISPEDANPEHLFQIASQMSGGVFAAHLGLIARYGAQYKNVNYLVKLNGKTNLTSGDPLSSNLHSVDDVIEFKKNSKLKISAIGLTLYIGSDYEPELMAQTAQAIYQAHKNGLVAILWIYPRGGQVKDAEAIDTLAGAAGTAVCLGADFVKVTYPYDKKKSTAEKYKQVTTAAGNCGVICVGGAKQSEKELLQYIEWQTKISGSSGIALGRNVHQRSLKEATELMKKVNKILNQ